MSHFAGRINCLQAVLTVKYKMREKSIVSVCNVVHIYLLLLLEHVQEQQVNGTEPAAAGIYLVNIIKKTL